MKPYNEMNIYDKASLLRDMLDDPEFTIHVCVNDEGFYPHALIVEEDGEDGDCIMLICNSINHTITRIDHRKEPNEE